MTTLDQSMVRTAQGLTSLTSSMLQTGRYSDLTIKCWEREFKVHRAVVCLQSKPLSTCDSMEAETSIIQLEADEPEIVEKMISFFYTQDYSDISPKQIQDNQLQLAMVNSSISDTAPSPLLMHAKVYVMAEKYDVPALKALSKEKYEAAASTAWDDIIFTESLKLIYEETPDSDTLFRDVAAKAAAAHLAKLVDRVEFEELCKINGEIGFDILNASLSSRSLEVVS